MIIDEIREAIHKVPNKNRLSAEAGLSSSIISNIKRGGDITLSNAERLVTVLIPGKKLSLTDV